MDRDPSLGRADRESEAEHRIRIIEQQLDSPHLSPEQKERLLERLATLRGISEPEDE